MRNRLLFFLSAVLVSGTLLGCNPETLSKLRTTTTLTQESLDASLLKLRADLAQTEFESQTLAAQNNSAEASKKIEQAKVLAQTIQFIENLKLRVTQGSQLLEVSVSPTGELQIDQASQFLGGLIGGTTGAYVGLAGTIVSGLIGLFAHRRVKSALVSTVRAIDHVSNKNPNINLELDKAWPIIESLQTNYAKDIFNKHCTT